MIEKVQHYDQVNEKTWQNGFKKSKLTLSESNRTQVSVWINVKKFFCVWAIVKWTCTLFVGFTNELQLCLAYQLRETLIIRLKPNIAFKINQFTSWIDLTLAIHSRRRRRCQSKITLRFNRKFMKCDMNKKSSLSKAALVRQSQRKQTIANVKNGMAEGHHLGKVTQSTR